MRHFLLLLCVLGCVFNLPAQTVRFDNPHNFSRYDYALYSGIVAYRVADYVSTEKAIGAGAREVELPSALVKCKPGFFAYSMGMAAVEISGSMYLHRHGHKTLARIVDSVSVGSGAATDIRNFTVR